MARKNLPSTLHRFRIVLANTFALLLTLLAIKKQSSKLNLEGIGLIMVAFGGYFMFNTITYYLTGVTKRIRAFGTKS